MPPAPDREDFTLEKWSRLTFIGAPRQPGRLVFDFVGTFECTLLDSQTTQVTHAYEFEFRKPFRWLERRLSVPLADEINQEVTRLSDLLTKHQS